MQRVPVADVADQLRRSARRQPASTVAQRFAEPRWIRSRVDASLQTDDPALGMALRRYATHRAGSAPHLWTRATPGGSAPTRDGLCASGGHADSSLAKPRTDDG